MLGAATKLICQHLFRNVVVSFYYSRIVLSYKVDTIDPEWAVVGRTR